MHALECHLSRDIAITGSLSKRDCAGSPHRRQPPAPTLHYTQKLRRFSRVVPRYSRVKTSTEIAVSGCHLGMRFTWGSMAAGVSGASISPEGQRCRKKGQEQQAKTAKCWHGKGSIDALTPEVAKVNVAGIGPARISA